MYIYSCHECITVCVSVLLIFLVVSTIAAVNVLIYMCDGHVQDFLWAIFGGGIVGSLV